MSFKVDASLRRSVRLKAMAENAPLAIQEALREAQMAGLAKMQEIVTGELEVRSGRLSGSVQASRNQYAVWFTIAGRIGGKPYGFAQEFGWEHPKGNLHPGHHMVERAMEEARLMFNAMLGGSLRNPVFTSSFSEYDVLEANFGVSGLSTGPVGTGAGLLL